MDVITADIGRSLVPDSLHAPVIATIMMMVMMMMLWCRKLEVKIDDRGDFDEVYDKIEDEGEAVVEEGKEEEEKREEQSITTLLHTTRSGRICRRWKGRASVLDFS